MNNNFTEKINVLKNKKILLGLLACLFGLCVIVITSVVPLVLKPENWGTPSFVSDLIINCAIAVIAMVGLIMVGISYNALQPNSKLAKAIVEFKESVATRIDPRLIAFIQWIKQVLEPNDQQDTYRKALKSVKITDTDYLKLTEPQLLALLKEPLKLEEHYYSQLNKKQYKVLTDILNGKYEIDFVDPWDWTKNSKYATTKNHSEKQSTRQKKKTSVLLYQVGFRLIVVIVISLIATGLVKDTQAQISTEEIMLKLFLRLFNFFGSAFLGFGVGCLINDFDAEYLLDKIDVHKEFESDKTFVAKTDQELKKEEYIKYQKEHAQIYNTGIEMKKGD